MVTTTLKTLRKTAGIAALALGMTGLAGSAQAFDFSGYDNWAYLDFSNFNEHALSNPGDIVFGDLTVTIMSFGADGTTPYLDGYDGNNPGGLGVCDDSRGQCNGSQVEEIDEGEAVKITLSKGGEILTDVAIESIWLRNQDHLTDFDGNNDGNADGQILITADAGPTDYVDLAANIDGNWTGTMFTFAHNHNACSWNCNYPVYNDFYIKKLKVHYNDNEHPPGVPEPATLAVFGFGLAGLGAIRRRRKTS